MKKANIYLPILVIILCGPILYRSAIKLPIFLAYPEFSWIAGLAIIIFIFALCNILYMIEKRM